MIDNLPGQAPGAFLLVLSTIELKDQNVSLSKGTFGFHFYVSHLQIPSNY